MEWKSIDLSSKLYLTKRGNVSYYYRVFIILIVGIGISWQFSKQISKLSFQLSVQKYSLLGQREGERVQEGGNTIIRDEKVSPFVKFETILSFLCFSLDPLQIGTAGHGVL